MNVLFFSGSLRTDSCNKKILNIAFNCVQNAGHNATLIDLKEYPFPLYDQDFEDAYGVPDSVKKMSDKIALSDALIIATPEYNGSISGVLKNCIDWLSRIKPVTIEGKQLLLLAASPSFLGGVRGLWHTRIPFEALGAHVYPTMFIVPKAYTAFNAHNELIDSKKMMELELLLHAFVAYSSRKIA
jgi:chromate reductase